MTKKDVIYLDTEDDITATIDKVKASQAGILAIVPPKRANMSDQARAMHLAELALDFSLRHLQPSGAFLVKVFQGVGFEDYIKLMRSYFARVVTRKPDSSRDRSNELYLLGTSKVEHTFENSTF